MIDVHEAQTRLTELLSPVTTGIEIILTEGRIMFWLWKVYPLITKTHSIICLSPRQMLKMPL